MDAFRAEMDRALGELGDRTPSTEGRAVLVTRVDPTD